jgi:branched-chain amino acid transport system permease protein
MSILLELALGIVWLWALYGLVSTAFALGFRVGGFFDLSVGGSFLVGAYASWALGRVVPLIVAVSIGVLLAALGAVALGHWLIAPLAVRLPSLALFVATLAILFIAQALAALAFGESALVLRSGPAPVFDLGPVNVTDVQLVFGATAAVSLMAVGMWLRISRWGRSACAVADDRELATLLAIPVEQTIFRCYAISGALAGLAGGFFVADRSIDPAQALTLLLTAMVAAVVGGESIKAAVVGAFVLAVLETVLGFLLPGNWRTTVTFTVLLVVLFARRGSLAQVSRRQI